MSTLRPAWVVVVTSPFGRALVVTGIVTWLFLHAVAYALAVASEVPPNSWATSFWVVVMTLALLVVELRRRRLRGLFAVLGVSGAPLWGAALTVVGVLEVVFRVASAVVVRP